MFQGPLSLESKYTHSLKDEEYNDIFSRPHPSY